MPLDRIQTEVGNDNPVLESEYLDMFYRSCPILVPLAYARPLDEGK